MRHYTVTNEDVGKEGLGLVFASRDIFALFDNGSYVRRVEIPSGARIKKIKGDLRLWRADRLVLREREKIDLDLIKRLIEEGADVSAGEYAIVWWALRNKNVEAFKFLLPYFDPKKCECYAIKFAAYLLCSEIVELLIPYSDQAAIEKSLEIATLKNNHEMMQLLKQHIRNN